MNPRALARSVRRKAAEVVGVDRYSRPSLHQIEDRLDRMFDGPGFFVEAGAFNGFDQSNTYWLERFRGWDGVLVEPLAAEASKARRRRRAAVVECALGAPEQSGSTVAVHYAGLMSTTDGALDDPASHVAAGLQVQGLPGSWTVDVPCRTLDDVMDEVGAPARIDLLSLDVEGNEPAVLRGLSRYRPKVVLIEVAHAADLDRMLTSMGYTCVDPHFTPTDALYRSTLGPDAAGRGS